MEIRDRPQDNHHGGSWMPRIGDGRADRYRHHATEGKLPVTSHADALGFLSALLRTQTSNLSASSTILGITVSRSSGTALRSMG